LPGFSDLRGRTNLPWAYFEKTVQVKNIPCMLRCNQGNSEYCSLADGRRESIPNKQRSITLTER
jgi:hypothetical protein